MENNVKAKRRVIAILSTVIALCVIIGIVLLILHIRNNTDGRSLVGTDTTENYYIDIINGVAVCRRCKKELFYIDRNKVVNYAFHIICSCGKQYNNRLPERSRQLRIKEG